jgi:hypothetical protein
VLARLRSFVRAAFGRRRFEREVDAELQFHLDARVADLVSQGVDRAPARQARFELGDPCAGRKATAESAA